MREVFQTGEDSIFAFCRVMYIYLKLHKAWLRRESNSQVMRCEVQRHVAFSSSRTKIIKKVVDNKNATWYSQKISIAE